MQCVWSSGSASPYDVRFADVNVYNPTTPSIAQTKNCAITTAATSGTCAFTSDVPTGDIVGVGIVTTSSSDTVSSITDSASNTYAKVASVATQSLSDTELWKSCITTAGTLTVTVTVSASVTFDIILYDVSNSYCRTMLSSTGTSTGATSSTVTAYSPPKNSIVIGVLGSGKAATVSASSGYTLNNNANLTTAIASSESYLSSGTSETTPFGLSASAAYNEVSMQVPPTEFAVTFKASYSGTAPATGAPQWCMQNGVEKAVGDLTTAGITHHCDYGSIAYAQDAAPGGSSTNQVSSTPLTYGLVGNWPLQEGSGTSAFDLSHNNNTGTLYNSPIWITGGGLNFTANTMYVESASNVPAMSSYFLSVKFYVTSWDLSASYYPLVTLGDTSTSGDYVSLVINQNSGNSNAFAFLDNGVNTPRSPAGYLTAGSWHTVSANVTSSNVWVCVDLHCADSAVTGFAFHAGPIILDKTPVGSWAQVEALSNVYLSSTLTRSEQSELSASTFSTLEHQITSPRNTYTVNYYQQTPDSVSYSVSGGGTPTAPTFTGVSLGQTLSHVVTLTTSAQTLWLDSGSAWSVPHVESATSTQRWATNPSTGTASSTIAPTYYNQYNQPTKIDYIDGGTTSVSLTCTVYGANNATALLTTSQNFWADSGGTCSVPATTSIVSGASRLSMGPTYSYSVSKSGSVPSVLDGYLQYYLTDEPGLSVSGSANGTSIAQTSSAYFDNATFTVTGHAITVPYSPNHASWLFEMDSAYVMLLQANPTVVPTMSQLQISWTSDCSIRCYVTVPSSTGNVFSSLTDSGAAIAPVSTAISGGTTYSFKGASPWVFSMSSSSPSQQGGSPGGGSLPPTSCQTGYLYNDTSGECVTVTGTKTIAIAPTTGVITQLPTGLIGLAVLTGVVAIFVVRQQAQKAPKRKGSQPKGKPRREW